MTLEQRLEFSEARSLEHIFPSNTNPLGNAFGGYIVSLMDKIAAFSAYRFSGGIVVTVSIDKLSFNLPILMGDYVEIVARVLSRGEWSRFLCPSRCAAPQAGRAQPRQMLTKIDHVTSPFAFDKIPAASPIAA